MAIEKEKTMMDYLRKISPGTPLRAVVDDLVGANLGALIVFDSPELQIQKMFEGGFRINCRFTPQKLFELCKMDGAIILSPDLKRILYANVLMTPDTTITTKETGTRHKAAERTAKQSNTFVIAVSERRRKTTIYLGNSKYYLKSSEEILRNLTSTLQVLEKQREIFNELQSSLNVLEVSEMVSTSDVCKIIQRAEMITKISETIKKEFTELGKEGNIINMRFRELIKNVDKIENEILRDYAKIPMKRAKIILSNFTFEGILELDAIARLLLEKTEEEIVVPRGYRFLSNLNLNEKEISEIVINFGNLNKILSAQESELEAITKNRTSQIKEEINSLREQILSGKLVC